MGVVGRAVAGVDRWFFAPQPIHALVIARIVFGGSVFLAHAARLPHVAQLYGPQGLAGPLWFPDLQPPLGDYPWDRFLMAWLEAHLPGLTLPMVWALYILLLLASLAFTLGFKTRISGVIAVLVLAYLQRARLPFVYWGWPSYVQPLMVYTLLAPSGRFVSIDAWWARRRGRADPGTAGWLAPAWPLRLLQVHVCAMYAVSGLARLFDPGWLEGQALFNAAAYTLTSRLVIDWQAFKPILALGTYGAWLLEPVAVVGLWVPRLAPWLAYALIAMHAGIELLSLVGYWSFVMSAGVASFLPTSHLSAVLRRLPGGAGAPDDPRVSSRTGS